jgi:cytoplasmic iron level regulating protein YaaA (DUF328/UPF0246 family)
MKRIVLISCVSKKLASPAIANNLYISPLFRFNLAYANQLHPDTIFILSAKYGLVSPLQVIEPYDLTLNDMSAREVRDWADHILAQLINHVDLKRDHFIFLAGQKYRKHLIPSVVSYEIPMQGLPIGKQLRYLKRHINE